MQRISKVSVRHPLARYALAVTAVAASFIVRNILDSRFGLALPPFIFLYPAVMAVAILAGLRPGLAATALAALGTDFLVLPPAGRLAIGSVSNAISLAFFTGMGVLISLLAERHRRSERSIAIYEREKAVRQSEDHYRNLFNSMEEGFCVIEMIFDAEGKPIDYRFIEVNRAFERQTGMHEPVGKRMSEFAPDIEDYWPELFGRVAVTGEPVHYANEAKGIGGHFEIHAYRIGDPELRRVAIVFSEVSARMRAEEAIKEQAALLDLARDSIMVRDLDGTIRFWNRGAEAMYGYTKEEAAGRNLHELLGTAFPQPLAEIERHVLEEGYWEGEFTHTTRDGDRIALASRWVLQRDKNGQPRGIMEINSDITERRQADEHMRRLNRVYTVLSDINQTIVREKDSRLMIEAACRIAVNQGLFRMAWIGMVNSATQLLEPIASSGIVEGYLDQVKIDLISPGTATGPAALCLRTGEHSVCNDIEHELFRPWKGHALRNGYRSLAAFPLCCEGKVVGVFSLYASEVAFFDDDETKLLDEMAMDISYALEVNLHEKNRSQAEEELRWRTAFFEAQVESSLDGIMVVNDRGSVILQNQRMREIWKIPEEIGESQDDSTQFMYVRSLAKDPEGFVERIAYLYAHPDEIGQDEIDLKDGTTLERYSSPVKDKSGKYYGRIWVFHDISARRQLEAQFRQAQKMEAIGQLTGGIAHDFNNLLTVIMGCSEVLGESVKEDSRLSNMAEMILNASRRGADLTHRMLAFARRQSLQPRPTNINRLLSDMKSFLVRTLSAEIELELIISDEVCEALIDPTELENALLNLCVNARDAMPGGGTLTIETRRRALDADYASQNPEVTPGQYILVTVSDTGCGISPENMSRVFDPFFTTKDVGKGSGLGLSMVYGFAKQSQGHVKIYSETGHGTSVQLFLPQSNQGAQLHSPSEIPAANLRGSEVILLVEDNDPLREYAKSQLIDLGYTVLEAANGKDALDVIRAEKDIDLLFTDVVMPGGMNGHELAQQASKLNPNLKVLYCSGYAESAILHQGLLDNNEQLLNKPYTRLELSRRIRNVLTASQQ